MSGAVFFWGTVLYGIQLYADFNGYTNIALGIAELFGIHLKENFRQPYFATSVQEFWHRWHMSFSTWLKEYVYIPLGGNRCSVARQYINILITFLVSGIWHGSGWKFIVWGAFMGYIKLLVKCLIK